MSVKTIELTIRQGDSTIAFRDTISAGATWMAQAYIFHKFLLAQGFYLEAEQVGADVAAYVHATDSVENEEW